MKTDLSILFEPIEFNKVIKLEIEPLAPLSMVSAMPGSYFRSLQSPTKFMLCGMFENLLGWHFSENDRKKIRKKVKKHFKNERDFELSGAKSGYKPLLGHLFEIETSYIPEVVRYDDLWTQHLKGRDERHLNGARNYGWQLEKGITQLENTGKARTKFFKEYKRKFPNYYTSPKSREFVIARTSYIYRLNTSKNFIELLSNFILGICSTAYLGTSEGWIEINCEEL
jgi:CRISPR-associated protein Cas5